ncbi:MAG: hypothetical protein ACRDWT_19760 [Jatrophihabitantaceae bacterium]
MASSEGVRDRVLTRALRASILALALIGAVVGALIGLAACATPRKPTAVAPGTSQSGSAHGNPQAVVPVAVNPQHAKAAVQKLFTPFDENGQLSVHASDGGRGSCFATSIAVPVSGVFRCLSGNTILDPCFAPVHETSPAEVTCFADPWSDGFTIHLAGKLPTYDPVLAAGDPWAIELTNGVRCVSVTGAVPSLGKVDLTYRCDVSMAAGITSGDNGTIIAHYGPVEGPLTDVAVATAWRGRSFRIGAG